MGNRVLALDIASTTGWACDRPSGGEIPVCGHFTVDTDGGNAEGRAATDFRRRLLELCSLHRPDHVVIEAPLPERSSTGAHIHGLQTASILLGLSMVAKGVAFEVRAEEWTVDVQSVRAHFLGSRWGKKIDVMARCRILKYPAQTHDEADACALWDYAKAVLRSGEVMARAEVGARR